MALFHPGSIAARARGADRLIPAVLGLAACLLPLGLALPLMTIQSFFVFSDRFSVLGSLVVLLNAREILLFVLLGAFGVVLPVGRLVLAGLVWARLGVDDPRFERAVGLLGHLGKWSMLEVMVLALVVVSLKLSLLGGAQTNPGIYLLVAAILFQIGGFHWLGAAGRRLRAPPRP